MNKGIKVATGDIVGILNSDDNYVSNTVIETIENTFITIGCDPLFGNVDFVAAANINMVIRH